MAERGLARNNVSEIHAMVVESEDTEPPGGLDFMQALEAFAQPEKREAWKNQPRLSNSRGVIALRRDSPEWQEYRVRERARRLAQNALIQDIWGQLQREEVIAWGAEGNPLGDRRRIPSDAWRDLHIEDAGKSSLKGPDGLKIYAVRFYRNESVIEGGDGLAPNELDSRFAPEIQRKPTVYNQVYDHLAQIEKEEDVDFSKHGEKARIARLIHKRMSKGPRSSTEVPLSSVERELRNILKARCETGENPEK